MTKHNELKTFELTRWTRNITFALIIVFSQSVLSNQPTEDKDKRPPSAGKATDEPDSPWSKVEIAEELKTGIEFKKPPKGTRFSFNLIDVDMAQLIKIIGNITGKSFILGGEKHNIKATVFAPNKVTAGEAYQVFLSVLAINNLGVVPAGRYLKIVPLGDSAQQNVPIIINQNVPEGDQIVTRLYRPTHVGANDIVDLLGRFKSTNGDIAVYAPTNLLIITDHGSSIRRLLKLLESIDVKGTGTQIWIEPVNHADASEIAERIQEIFDAASQAAATSPAQRAGKSPGKSKATRLTSSTTGESSSDTILAKIIPDERTNSLVVIATENAYFKTLELIKRLDVPVAGRGTLHLLKLQHANAAELAKTLNELSQGGRGSAKGAKGNAGNALFEGEVKISPDESTNSLAIVATMRDFINIKELVSELDVLQQQVFVEVVILEVGVDTDLSRGLGFHSGGTQSNSNGNTLIYGASQPVGSVSSLTPSMLSGLAVGILGPEIEGAGDLLGLSIPSFGVTLHALQTNNDANILSTPYVLATNNEEATIVVGKSIPVQQGMTNFGSLMSQAAAQSGTELPNLSNFSSIGRQNVGLTLKIKPQINDDQQVRLAVEVEVSNRGSVDPELGPDIAQKSTTTSAIVADQKTIVIGGLITDTEVTTTNKVPVLGDIPLLGFFFRHKRTVVEKRNLLIFLTPHIIRSHDDFKTIFQRKMAERREFIERWTAFEHRRIDPQLDWSRTNGALSEINRVLAAEQQERQLRQQFEDYEEVPHTPKEPISTPDREMEKEESEVAQVKVSGEDGADQELDSLSR